MGSTKRFGYYHGGVKLFKGLRSTNVTLKHKHNVQLLFVYLVLRLTNVTLNNWESIFFSYYQTWFCKRYPTLFMWGMYCTL